MYSDVFEGIEGTLDYAEEINPEFERGVVWNRPRTVEFDALEALLNSWKGGDSIDEELLDVFLATVREGDSPEDIIKWAITTYCHEIPMHLKCLFRMKTPEELNKQVRKLGHLLDFLKERDLLRRKGDVENLQLTLREKFFLRSAFGGRGPIDKLGEEKYIKQLYREGDDFATIKGLILDALKKAKMEVCVDIDEVVGGIVQKNDAFFACRNRGSVG